MIYKQRNVSECFKRQILLKIHICICYKSIKKIHYQIEVKHFLYFLIIRSAGLSYERFIATSCKFTLSRNILDPLVMGKRGCVQRDI